MRDQSPADLNRRIAARVHGRRAQAGLSLARLADASGVSRSMLSLIERGETSATAVVLDRIATALGVPLAALFDPPAAAGDPVSRGRERATWRDPQSGYERRAVSPPGVAAPFRIVEVTLPVAGRVAYESPGLVPPASQQVWVREGVLVVACAGAQHRLEADDCLAMTIDGPVVFTNPGDAPVRYVVVVAYGAGDD